MKHLICLVILSLALFASSEKIDYTGYKVYRFVPETEEQLKQLQDFQDNNSLLLDFWQDVSKVNQPVDILFPPHLQGDMIDVLSQNIKSSVMIQNVQKLIDEEGAAPEGTKNINWSNYFGVNDIYAWLNQQASNSHVELINIGSSTQGRDLLVTKISRGSSQTKPQIWVDSLLHAREWITGALCTYMINELVNSNDPAMVALGTDFEWHILAVSNPDGYQFSRDSNRMWRKTRKTYGTCFGADPNRNWEYKWMQGGASANPCSDTHAGDRPWSEPETTAMSNYIRTLNRIVFYLSLHSYSQLILLPYGVGNTQDRYPPEFNAWMTVGTNTANAIRQRYGTSFRPGNIIDLLYVASGGSMDWVRGSELFPSLKLAFTFELRDTGSSGFILPPAQILPSSLEFMDGLHVMVNAVRTTL